jgi:hypothetical protein
VLLPDAAERFGRGLILLIVGLGKKVLLGDPLAEFVNPVFEAAGDVGGERRKPVFGRLDFAIRPFNQQPFRRPWISALIIAIGR